MAIMNPTGGDNWQENIYMSFFSTVIPKKLQCIVFIKITQN